MEVLKLALFALSSVFIGYIYNLSLALPVIGTLLFWLMPFILLIYWFWVGRKFAVKIKKPLVAIIYGNICGIISVLLYLWQFNYLQDLKRNIWLAVLSQAYSAPLSWITVRLGVLFEARNSTITQTTYNAMQVLGLLFMVIAFAAGYWLERKKLYKSQKLDFN